MLSIIFLFFSFFYMYILLFINTNEINKSKKQITKNYNYYSLAVQKWCGQNCSYQIHGFWPEISSGNWPQYCNNMHYNSKMPNDLLLRMNHNWNTCDNILIFGIIEWEKHGTCFNVQTKLNQSIYFTIALDLFDKIKDTINNNTCGDECITSCFSLNYTKIQCQTLL